MTTISPNRRRKGSHIVAYGAATALLLCIVLVGVARPQLESVLWKLLAPLMVLRNAASQSTNEQLRASLASTTAALADRDELYRQTLELKALLNRTDTSKTTLAAVLMHPPGIPYDTLVIDIGQNAHVTAGALVFAGGTSAIGTVSDVYADTARVLLFSAPGTSYQALVHGTPVTLSGQGAGSMRGEVPAGTAVAAGDPVTLPGLLSAFAGSVSYVRQESGASFIEVFVQMPVDVFSLQFVEVQTP